MIILYESNSGYTEQYAKLLSKELDIPAYSVKGIPECHRGKDAIFLGWLMAGTIMGYKKAASFCTVRCAVGVGMSPPSTALVEGFYEKMKIDRSVAVYYLQGGFDINKLSGPFKLIMKLKVKEIAARFEGKSALTPEEQATYDMTRGGYSCVCADNLKDIVSWAKAY